MDPLVAHIVFDALIVDWHPIGVGFVLTPTVDAGHPTVIFNITTVSSISRPLVKFDKDFVNILSVLKKTHLTLEDCTDSLARTHPSTLRRLLAAAASL